MGARRQSGDLESSSRTVSEIENFHLADSDDPHSRVAAAESYSITLTPFGASHEND